MNTINLGLIDTGTKNARGRLIMKTNLDHLNELAGTNDTLEDVAVGTTLSMAIDETGGEYSDAQIRYFIGYFHSMKKWLAEPAEVERDG